MTSFPKPHITILKWIIGVFAFFNVLWWGGFVNSYFLGFPYWPNYNIIWISIPAVSYIVGYFMLSTPDFFRHPALQYQAAPKKELREKRLSTTMADSIRSKLILLMKNQKLYLNSDLSLKSLSEELQVSTNDLSWVLNEIIRKKFYDFVNEYRIEEFISRVHQGEHEVKTILALAFESGFRSKSTFNKAFCDSRESTPSDYIKGLSQTERTARIAS